MFEIFTGSIQNF